KELASGMNVIAFLPEADVRRASYAQGKSVIMMTLAVALFVLVAVLVLLRYLVVKPVAVLNAAAQAISEGNLNVAIDTGRGDEIGELGRHLFELNRDLRQTHEEASYLENHDSLTGLPNQRMFGDYLENMIAVASTRKHCLGLLFIKLDNLKAITDSHGQAGGECVLKAMAARLDGSLRKHTDEAAELHDKACDIVCRYADDDFIVLLDNIDGPWDATVVCDRILKSLHQPVAVDDSEVMISCSIGATVYPDDSLGAQELIKNADIAMYRAKEHGENHYQFFSEKTDTVMHEHLRIYAHLRNAIDNDQFFMEYQPKLDTASGRMVGMEALIRWQDPEHGLVEPEVFLPIAEDSGLISEITRWVIDDVCRQANAWFLGGQLTVPVAVNISALEFRRFDLLSVLTDYLEETELPAELLELELTEAALQSGTDDVIEIITGLKRLGVGIALNNFGTGYSSLSDLNRLPVNTLKIDRHFVAQIKTAGDDSALISAIVSMGHALGLSVVADGVETETQRDYLKAKGCDAMQGFLFSRPLSVDDITSKLDELLVADD
ncbi:MAG: EAL domain-containing protein, partial [Gammaproteobacteria bacterium]|nr:EAL domain-containing protein [Gammaproteobacteria bacterium]